MSFGARLSDIIATFVGSWRFVILYTTAMFLWIGLHTADVLHIDTPDFIRWNLWLSYFAGIQASILLMASNRELEKDRERMTKTLSLTQANLDRLQQLSVDIDDLEAQLDDIQERVDD